MERAYGAAITYQLIVTRRQASEILLIPAGSEWIMPRVEIHPQKRLAEQLTTNANRAWGVDAYCLLIPSISPHSWDGPLKCAVMESERQDDKAPAGTSWVSRIGAEVDVEPTESKLIRQSLEELDAYVTNRKAGPFARPGWLRELCGWAQSQLTQLGLRLTGHFRQLNAGPTFSLIRLETNREAVWFKATGKPNSHELSVTATLARLFPGRTPPVLAIHETWNGWLSLETDCIPLDEVPEFSFWEQAARELAELQIASIGKIDDLIDAQAKDLRISALAERIDPFLDRMTDFMTAQEKRTPAPLIESEIATLAEGLKGYCTLLDSLGLPNALGHVDLNPGNILVSRDRCVFLDWAEGCVANPLLTFEYLRQHLLRSGIKEPAAGERLATAYLRPWSSFYSPSDLWRAAALARLIAVFVHAVANDSWRSVDASHNPTLAGYFRSLTRRMYREVVRVAEGSELCLS